MILLLFVICILVICSLINKDLVSKINPFTIQAIQGTLNLLLVPLWFYLAKKLGTSSRPLSFNIIGLASLGGILSTLGFLLFLTALRDKPVWVASAFLSIHPIVTMFICSMMGERLSFAQSAGVVIICSGVVLVQLGSR